MAREKFECLIIEMLIIRDKRPPSTFNVKISAALSFELFEEFSVN